MNNEEIILEIKSIIEAYIENHEYYFGDTGEVETMQSIDSEGAARSIFEKFCVTAK